ncbi:choice-of-anchor I domain-containing protein [Fischerella thermalis]|uniref:choice-of-anchor I domain-containing protein n=1 Tax=Fischerella thermalis TaxID=372787 RepID=UPI0015E06585|nr:hypothetical protein [Fischerella thermalis]
MLLRLVVVLIVAIATFVVDAQTYIITANEGDARDYDTFSEEVRVKNLALDPEAFPNAEQLQQDEAFNTFDNRSDDKVPEPEGVVTGVIGDRTYSFIGLERVSGIMVYDITQPINPTFVQYINPRDFSIEFDVDEAGEPAPTPEQLEAAGDLGPEGLVFTSAEDSPNGQPLLVVANK